MTNHDILAVSEHWLHANRLNKLSDVDDKFNVIGRSSRYAGADVYGSNCGQGGVCIYWRKNLTFISPIKTLIHDRICGVRAQVTDNIAIRIFSVYMPAAGSNEDLEYSLDELSSVIIDGGGNSHSIICGDFNGDISRCHDDSSLQYKHGKLVKIFISHCNLTAANCLSMCSGPKITHFGPTGSSMLDYIMVSNALVGMIKQVKVLDEEGLNTPDHNPISMSLLCDIPHFESVNRKPRVILNGIRFRRMTYSLSIQNASIRI